MTPSEEIMQFLKDNPTFYLATVDGYLPRVRNGSRESRRLPPDILRDILHWLLPETVELSWKCQKRNKG